MNWKLLALSKISSGGGSDPKQTYPYATYNIWSHINNLSEGEDSYSIRLVDDPEDPQEECIYRKEDGEIHITGWSTYSNKKKTITQNGTDIDVKTYGKVDVNVSGGSNLQHGSAVQNGLLEPEQGYDGFDYVNVAVPNSYTSSDEGKVVSNGALVSQTSATKTINGVYDTTLNNEVVVAVPQPSGNINITDTAQTDVSAYATAQVVDADLVAGNIKKDVNILGVTGSYEGGGITPTGTIQISSNGTGIDVAQYAYADVAVPTTQQDNYLIVDDAPINCGAEIAASMYNYPLRHAIPQCAKYLMTINFKTPAGQVGDTMVFGGIYNSDFESVYTYLSLTTVTFDNDFWTKYPNCIGIGAYAFTGCNQLTGTAPLSPTCKYIGNYAFAYCSQLSLSALPSDLQVIQTYAFRNCTSMFSSTLHIPASVIQVGNRAFMNCTQLQTVYFDGTPTTTGTIPAALSTSAFYGCSNITDIYVPWSEGEIPNAPWGATNATIHYDYVPTP